MRSMGIKLCWIRYVITGCLGVLVSMTQAATTINPLDWVKLTQRPSPNLENLTIPADAACKGMWSPVFDWPMNGLHAALLADGRVLSTGGGRA